jgi:hypothetical protein
MMVWPFGCRYFIEATRIIAAKGCSDGLAPWLFGCRYCIEAPRIITAKGCSDGLAVCCHYCIEATSIISEKGCLKKNHNHASSAPILELSAKRCFALYKSTSLIF